jgi:hypothetical protein
MTGVGVTPRTIRVGKVDLDPVDGLRLVFFLRLQDELFENGVAACDNTTVMVRQYREFQSIRPPKNNKLNCHVFGTAYLIDNISYPLLFLPRLTRSQCPR